MPTETDLERLRVSAETLCLEDRWTMIVDLEVMLFNTHPLNFRRQRKLRKLIRIYRKGLPQ